MGGDDWPKENIPDEDALFMRVHRSLVPHGELQPNVFRNHGGGMSTNWQKYCKTPQESQSMGRRPQDNGVIELTTGPVRALELVVEHAPTRTDRSHTDVRGVTTEKRLKLFDIAKWRIRVPAAGG